MDVPIGEYVSPDGQLKFLAPAPMVIGRSASTDFPGIRMEAFSRSCRGRMKFLPSNASSLI
jgi:hypothetical protein